MKDFFFVADMDFRHAILVTGLIITILNIRELYGQRLPKSITPRRYHLTLLTHMGDDQGFGYYGEVSITVN